MNSAVASNKPVPAVDRPTETNEAAQRVMSLVARAGRLLPAQGPLTGFAFLNPLQGFEDLPFEEGMKRGESQFPCKSYLPKESYREKLATGRIKLDDVRAVLQSELAADADKPITLAGTRFEMRLAMLQYPLHSAPPEELRWFIAETEALTRFGKEVPMPIRRELVEATRHWVMRELARQSNSVSDSAIGHNPTAFRITPHLLRKIDARPLDCWDESTWDSATLQLLWLVCRDGVKQAQRPVNTNAESSIRHRALLLAATGQDSDLLVHPVLIRFCAAFTDQGISNWVLPDRNKGFLHAFCTLHQSASALHESWMRPLVKMLGRIRTERRTPADIIVESLDDLAVPEQEWSDYIDGTVLALRGWAGMIWQMETRDDRVAKPVPTGSLLEFVAVQLLLERCALRHICNSAAVPIKKSLTTLRSILMNRLAARTDPSIENRVFYVFQLAQYMGWNPQVLEQLTIEEWESLIAEIEAFPSLDRRRILHRAFERRLRVRALDAIAIKNLKFTHLSKTARFQCVFCLDAREESFRRHLEEQDSGIETFGAAGFFGIPMYFRGIDDAHFSAQCPVVIRPKHRVVEDITDAQEEMQLFRVRSRRVLGLAAHQIHLDSRSFASGMVLSAGLGTLASIPLVMRVLFPSLAAKIRGLFGRFVAPPPMTRLQLERKASATAPDDAEIGFTVEEMGRITENLLRDIGITSSFSRLVFFIGHGSTCQNNPHRSTYDCGACTGNAGGANARAVAAMLNNPRVRLLLGERGLLIPDETRFIGGLHNTCKDTVSFYDLDQLPKTHLDEFASAKRAIDTACERNAHERCRRFYSAPLNQTASAALQHVQDRSEDLAQTRPEFGNASNAMCIVGRRSRSQGLFLDRRSFLQSYDPTSDDSEYTILGRILGAVIPVCSGINMQYYLSAVDSLGWGCGTKLPHNVVSLLGVMDGASSDLRCGLPLQSTEIHEPVRCLFVIETTPDGIRKVMQRNPAIARILGNGWAQLALLAPESNELQVYEGGSFQTYRLTQSEIPKAATSIDWYRGRRDHLPFALIES
jgi:uncharacterized protein YbcC (UPF0753/DUF2309 family)